jgi:hypothetical protein
MNLDWQIHYFQGKEYFYNPVTNQSQWERPQDYLPPPPPIIKEVCIYKKEITPEWSIYLTSKEHELFYNKITKESTWDIPEDIQDILQILLNDESENEDYHKDIQDELLVNQPENATLQNVENIENPTPIEIQLQEPKDVEVAPTAKKPKTDLDELIKEYTEIIHQKANPFSTLSIESEKLNLYKFNEIPKHLKSKIFTDFCVVKSNEIIKEKQNSKRTRKDDFLELLNQKVVKKIRFEDFKRVNKKDKRFYDDEESRDLFKNHVKGLDDLDLNSKKLEFYTLLEQVVKSNNQTWLETRLQIEKDARYLAIPTPIQREDLFRKYLEKIK